ncbi:unnamed protein product [Linum tenue]|uniref:Thionin-like protein n=1 Tax=Linum tenue TaxID=586396 RepID=A0AAV0GUC8_9ROSI|nr:unnamed protein product [Linum tenue]
MGKEQKLAVVMMLMGLVLVCSNLDKSSSSGFAVVEAAPDFQCYDGCITGCVQPNTRLMRRCEVKCDIRCNQAAGAAASNGQLG